MPKYEIYRHDSSLPLTIIEANNWGFSSNNCLRFWNVRKEIVAVFNFDNIAGFKEILE